MYAGGGFEGGASQFAGGGFMPSQGAATGSAQKKSFDNKNQTLRAVTVKQLHKACSVSMDDTLIIDDQEITNVSLVARIVSKEEQNVACNLCLDDGTGQIKTQYYVDQAEDETMRQRRAEWQPGTYVRVHGSMRSLNRERSLLAFNVHPVTDFNEVTYHSLQAVFQHAHLTKGAAAMKPEGGAPAYNGATATAPAPAAGGYGGGDQLPPMQKEVLDIYTNERAAGTLGGQGLSVAEVAQKLGGRLSVAQVQQAVVALTDQGHLYSTIDDQHFMPC